MVDFHNLEFAFTWAKLKLTYNDKMKPPKSHSTQIAAMKELENAKVALMDPRNTTAAEIKMWYKVMKAPRSNLRSSHSFDKYLGC